MKEYEECEDKPTGMIGMQKGEIKKLYSPGRTGGRGVSKLTS